MRRKDREVTDPERIDAIIRACHCCRLGFYDNGEVYIVPLDFGYDEKEGKRTFYFHGAKEGRRMDCILRSPRALGLNWIPATSSSRRRSRAGTPPATGASSGRGASRSSRPRRKSGPPCRRSCSTARERAVGISPTRCSTRSVFFSWRWRHSPARNTHK